MMKLLLVVVLTFFSLTAISSDRIAVVVNKDLYPSVKSEVDRLVQDLEDENNLVVLKEWEFNKSIGFRNTQANYDAANELINYLNSLYQEPDTLNGAILIGVLPRRYIGSVNSSRPYNDLAFMHLNIASTISWISNGESPKIWVSRFWGVADDFSVLSEGKESLLIKRMLDTNHNFRKGLSRFPHRSITYASLDTPSWSGLSDPITIYSDTLFPNLYSDNIYSVTQNLGTYNELMFGSDFMLNTSHGNVNTGGHAMEAYRLPNQTPQTRFLVSGWTRPNDGGEVGGIGTQAMFVKNSGVVVSLPNSGWPYPIDRFVEGGNFLQKLNQGLSYGDAYLAHHSGGQLFGGDRYTVFNGDLSLKAKMHPHNEMPTINGLIPSETSGIAPFTTTFSNFVATDTDGSIVKYEVYPEGFDFGKVSPAYSDSTAPNSLSHTYNFSGRYNARVEVMDNYMARGYEEVEIIVGHDSARPLRVNAGGSSPLEGNFDRYIWHNSNLDIIDSEGNFWRHDQDVATGTWGHLYNPQRSHNFGSIDVVGTIDDKLFHHSVFANNIEYHFPLENGDYELDLGFMEPEANASNERLIDIYINDILQQSAFDIYAEAGGKYIAINKPYLVTVTDGVLEIRLAKNTNSTKQARLHTIEIVPVGHSNIPPESSIISNITSGIAPLTVNFNGQGTDEDGDSLIYKWHFDDSETSTEINPAHTFITAGNYNVRLHVFDLNGGASESIVAINVLPNDSNAVTYSISADSDSNGSILPTGEQTVVENDSLTFTITPDAGYEVDQILVDGVALPNPVLTYEFSDVSADHTIHVSFKETNMSSEFTVTTSIIGSGSINLPGPHTVDAGANMWFSFGPAAGYEMGEVFENGVNLGIRSSYSMQDIQEDKLLEVHFVPTSNISHEITASTGTHGTISSPGVNQVTDHGSLAFTITPDVGYEVDQILVDGVALPNPALTYVFSDVIADHTIHVSFKETNMSSEFTVTTSIIGSGSINSPGPLTFDAGANHWFAFYPAAGYEMGQVFENGVNLGIRSSYTMHDIQEDKILEIHFVPN